MPDAITALSANGSRLALDAVPPLRPADQNHFRQRILMLSSAGNATPSTST